MTDVIDVGCERLPFAADALNVLIRELKLNCIANNCKLLVVCDGINSLFSERTLVHREATVWKKGPYYTGPGLEWAKNCVKVRDVLPVYAEELAVKRRSDILSTEAVFV